MDTENQRLETRVTGRVQGVGFRHFTTMRAQELDLHGWVRNEPDGAVQVVAEGRRPALEKLLHTVQSGPRAARVEDVSSTWAEAEGTFDGFRVRYA